jgi:NTE family protein
VRVTDMIASGAVRENKLKRMLIHAISAEADMSKLGVTSKLCADWEFLVELKGIGRATAESWLRDHFDALGRRSTVDIEVTYL